MRPRTLNGPPARCIEVVEPVPDAQNLAYGQFSCAEPPISLSSTAGGCVDSIIAVWIAGQIPMPGRFQLIHEEENL